MRVGFNPHKDKKEVLSGYWHQIIVPVYLPSEGDYFKDGLTILKLCLESLIKTVHSHTFITVINNGSSQEVADYLENLFREKQIQELTHTANIGKLNSVLKGLSGGNFDFVTIADADVLFLNGWQQAAYDIFLAFPKTGAVCPTPSSKSFRENTANIWGSLMFSSKLSFRPVADPEGLKAFAHSIGNPGFYNEEHLKKYLTVKNAKSEAVIGAGHFVTTYRGDIFSKLRTRFSPYKLGGKSENQILDLPVVGQGFWRLSTKCNYAYHMGNVFESWMYDTFGRIDKQEAEVWPVMLSSKPYKGLMYHTKYDLLVWLLRRKSVIRKLLPFKGLEPQNTQKYLS